MAYIVVMGLLSKGWPLTVGKVLNSEVRTKSSRSRSGSTSYEPYVFYEYSVNGKKMQSGQLAFGGRLQVSEKRAQKVIENYPAGKNIPVYYNPKKPGQAVIISGNIPGAYVMLGIGLVFIALGVTGIIAGW